jgi:hypothetical protein
MKPDSTEDRAFFASMMAKDETLARYRAALTEIANTIIRSWPPPTGDDFGPRVKLEDALNLRQVARDALKG